MDSVIAPAAGRLAMASTHVDPGIVRLEADSCVKLAQRIALPRVGDSQSVAHVFALPPF